MSFGFPPDLGGAPSPALDPMLDGYNADAAQMEAVDPAAMPLEGEEEYTEPAPRPIDWRVRKFWNDANERHTFGRYLCEEIDRAREAFSWRYDNSRVWRDDFEGMPAPADVPYPGAPTVRAPFTKYACEGHTTRLDAQIVQPDPVIVAEPMEMEAVDAAPDIEEASNAKLEDAEWAIEARALHKDLPVVGNGFVRVLYERRLTRAPRLEVDFDPEAFRGLMVAGADPLTAQLQAMKRDRKGAISYTLGWEETVDYAGTTFKFIPFEDGIIFPATCRDARKARGIGERVIISGLDLAQGAKDGLFIPAEVDALLERSGDDPTGAEGEDWTDRRERLEHQGIEVGDTEGPLAERDAKYREYLCYRLSVRFDGDDDGKEEILHVMLHYDTRRVLDVRFSHYEHGQHCYHHFPFKVRPGELLGSGTAEEIAVIQDSATAALNHILTHGDLTINRSTSFIVGHAAGLDVDEFVFRPGMIVPVMDERAIREWPHTPLPAEHYQVFQQLKDIVDLVAGTSNPSLGQVTDTQRTAREVTIATSNANLNFEGVAEGVALCWSRVWDQMRSIEAQFGEGGQVRYRRGRKARAAAQDPAEMFGAIDAETMMAKVKLVPAGLRQLSDMQSRMSQAMAMNNEFQRNPLTANNPAVWRLAIEATMEAAKYAPKEKVLLAIDGQMEAEAQAAEAAAQMAAEALQAGAVPPGGGGAAPEGATAEPAGTGQAPPPGALGPEQGGPLPGVV